MPLPQRIWPKREKQIDRVLSKERYARTREITINASEDVVEKLYAAVQISFALGR